MASHLPKVLRAHCDFVHSTLLIACVHDSCPWNGEPVALLSFMLLLSQAHLYYCRTHYHVTVMWPSVTIMWPSCDHLWPSCDYHVTICGHHVTVIWPSCDHLWPSCDCHMTIMWLCPTSSTTHKMCVSEGGGSGVENEAHHTACFLCTFLSKLSAGVRKNGGGRYLGRRLV